MLVKGIYIFFIVLFWSVLAVFLANNSGKVEITFFNWKIITSVPVLFFLSLLVTFLLVYGIRFYNKLKRYVLFIFGKKTFPVYSKKGYELLASSQMALSKGDLNRARHLAERAEAMLLGSPLALMASSQVLEMSGKEKAALKKYKKMAENPKSEIVGLKGLIDYALANNKKDQAYVLCKRAYELKKDSPWILETKFKLEVEKDLFKKAEITLKRAHKNKLFDDKEKDKLLGVIFFEQAKEIYDKKQSEEDIKNVKNLLDKAIKYNPRLVPVYIFYANLLIEKGEIKEAIKVLSNGFKQIGSQELAKFFYSFWVNNLIEENNQKKSYSYVKDFTLTNKKSPISLIYRIRACLHLGWLEKAGSLIEKYENLFDHTKEFLILKADYLDIQNHDTGMVVALLKEAAYLEDKEYYRCRNCRTTFSNWKTFCSSCHKFGTLDLEVKG